MMKKSCVRFAGAILGAFLCIFLSGCYPVLDLEPRETSDLSVIQLINKQNKAADPNRVWRRADSYYMRLKVTLTGKDTKDYFGSEVWYQHPKCFRLATSKNGEVQKVLIYNDGRVWNVNPRTNHSVELSPDSLEYCLFLNTVRMGTPSMNYTDIFRRISVDMYTEDGVRHYRMICMSDDERIQPYIFYYNGNTFLQEKLETVNIISSSGAAILYTSRIEQYITFDGIKLPARTIVETGDVVQVSELQDVVLNQAYPESLFLPPVPFTHKADASKPAKVKVPADAKKTAAVPEDPKKSVAPGGVPSSAGKDDSGKKK